jgi:putative hydrolase of HD superfamily
LDEGARRLGGPLVLAALAHPNRPPKGPALAFGAPPRYVVGAGSWDTGSHDLWIRSMSEQARILDFLALAERLKAELRHSWLSSGRQESVAEHCWQMALMAMLVHRHLAEPVDLGRALEMILTHDQVEAEAGDVPFFDQSERKTLKPVRERAAIEAIRERLGAPLGEELYELWHEFEAKATPEAKLASALDQLEVQIQHNLAGIETWTPIEYDLVYTKMDRHCAYDPFLAALCDAVKDQAEAKMRAAGIDVDAVKRGLAEARAHE